MPGKNDHTLIWVLRGTEPQTRVCGDSNQEARGERSAGDGEGGEVGSFRPEDKFSGLAHKMCLRVINSKMFANDLSYAKVE